MSWSVSVWLHCLRPSPPMVTFQACTVRYHGGYWWPLDQTLEVASGCLDNGNFPQITKWSPLTDNLACLLSTHPSCGGLGILDAAFEAPIFYLFQRLAFRKDSCYPAESTGVHADQCWSWTERYAMNLIQSFAECGVFDALQIPEAELCRV